MNTTTKTRKPPTYQTIVQICDATTGKVVVTTTSAVFSKYGITEAGYFAKYVRIYK